MTNSVRYVGEETRGLSPAIWKDFLKERAADPSSIAFFFDDFGNFSQEISAQNIAQYASYIDTGVTIKSLAVQDLSEGEHGILEVAGNDADNDEGSITTGGNVGTIGLISDTAAQAKRLAFECRIKKASVDDNACAFFIGLSEEGLAAADTLVDNTGELADKDFCGFRVKQDNGEELDFAWSKAGDATAVQEHAALTSLVADTWVKLGFLYDPDAPTAKRIKIFIDGVEQTSYVTGAQIAAEKGPASTQSCD